MYEKYFIILRNEIYIEVIVNILYKNIASKIRHKLLFLDKLDSMQNINIMYILLCAIPLPAYFQYWKGVAFALPASLYYKFDYNVTDNKIYNLISNTSFLSFMNDKKRCIFLFININ